MATGTLGIQDLLANNNQSVVEVGIDAVQQIFENDARNYNVMVDGALASLTEATNDRQRKSGGSSATKMFEVSEHGRAPTQKVTGGQLVGFPLRNYETATGWTKQALKQRSAADIAMQWNAAKTADLAQVKYDLMTCLFRPTNYTFYDYTQDGVALAIKAAINADSSAIPNGPEGQTFDTSTHTHYDGASSLTANVVTAAITDLTEHGHSKDVRIEISSTDEAAFRGLSGFTPLIDPRISLNFSANQAITPLDITTSTNRHIGYFGAASVWVKPYAVANYFICYDALGPKPIARRTPKQDVGFHLEAENEAYPWYIGYWQRQIGFGFWNRTNLVVVKFDNATYSAPTFTAP